VISSPVVEETSSLVLRVSACSEESILENV
jgi:hypothetical protein